MEEDLDNFQGQFEFNPRRAITEAAPHRAACRYDSAEDHDDEELAINGADFFDLNMLPDSVPADLFQENTKHSVNMTGNSLKPALFKSGKLGAKEFSGKPTKPGGASMQNNLLPNKVFANTRGGYIRSN